VSYFLSLLTQANSASAFCHPDEASIASGWKDLGQLRFSEAGSGFEIAQRSILVNAAKQNPVPAALSRRCPRSFHPLAMLASSG
jgi:hypothetical protein